MLSLALYLVSQTPLELPPPPLAPPQVEPERPQIPGEGLTPFQPPEGTPLLPSLRLSPDDSAIEIRQIKETDRVQYLRSMGHWYEVDLLTTEGLRFRGWAKGTLADERKTPQPSPSPTQASQTPADPLAVKGLTWFWAPEATERGSLRLHLGFQNLFFQLKGTTSAGDGQSVPPGYNFNGMGLLVSGELIPLMTTALNRKLFPVLRLDYLFGFHRVSFSNPFPQIPEVAGKGYEVQTQAFRIEGLTRFRAFEQQRGYIQFGFGLGFYYHTVAPDLSPVQGGLYNGQLVFYDNTISSISIPIEITWHFLDTFYVIPKYYYLANPKVSESAAQTDGLKISGMPLAFSFTTGWQLSKHWALEAELDWLDVGTKGGSGSRFGVDYTNGVTDIESRRFMGGVRYQF